MKRLFFLHILCCIFIGSINAQTKDGVYNFTLQQAVEYAYEHQNAMMNAKLDEAIAHAQVREIKGAGLPQLTGSFDFKDFIEFPTSVIPASAFDTLAPKDLLIPVKFGTKYNATAGLTASQ